MGSLQFDKSLIVRLFNLVHSLSPGIKLSHYVGERCDKLGIHKGGVGFTRLSYKISFILTGWHAQREPKLKVERQL